MENLGAFLSITLLIVALIWWFSEPPLSKPKRRVFYKRWRDKDSYYLFYSRNIIGSFENNRPSKAQAAIDAYCEAYDIEPMSIGHIKYKTQDA